MKKLLIFLFLLHTGLLFAQVAPADTSVKQITEVMPEFPGGMKAMMKFISKNIRYPKAARENGVQGRVVASFVVNTDGTLSDIRILKRLGWGCDEEVERVLLIMPLWKPASIGGKPVPVQFNLPVAFKLDGEDSSDSKESFIGAHYKGGETALQQFINQNLKYPKKALKSNVEGTVVAQAIIDDKGKVKRVEVLKHVNEACDKEAICLIKSLPAFQPAIRNGVAVESTYLISIKFKLPEPDSK